MEGALERVVGERDALRSEGGELRSTALAQQAAGATAQLEALGDSEDLAAAQLKALQVVEGERDVLAREGEALRTHSELLSARLEALRDSKELAAPQLKALQVVEGERDVLAREGH